MQRRSKEMSKDFPNRYSTTLLAIGKNLTDEDLSSIKLLLQCNRIATIKDLDLINNHMDVLSFLDKRQIIHKKDIDFLEKILLSIKRIDLKRAYVDAYRKTIRTHASLESKLPLYVQPASACVNVDDTDQNGTENEFTRLKTRDDATCALAAVEPSMDMDEDDLLPSSQESITDDDKLALS